MINYKKPQTTKPYEVRTQPFNIKAETLKPIKTEN